MWNRNRRMKSIAVAFYLWFGSLSLSAAEPLRAYLPPITGFGSFSSFEELRQWAENPPRGPGQAPYQGRNLEVFSRAGVEYVVAGKIRLEGLAPNVTWIFARTVDGRYALLLRTGGVYGGAVSVGVEGADMVLAASRTNQDLFAVRILGVPLRPNDERLADALTRDGWLQGAIRPEELDAWISRYLTDPEIRTFEVGEGKLVFATGATADGAFAATVFRQSRPAGFFEIILQTGPLAGAIDVRRDGDDVVMVPKDSAERTWVRVPLQLRAP